MFDERAMIADDHDQQGRGVLKVAEGKRFAGGGFGQAEIGGGRAERQHGGGGLSHAGVSWVRNGLIQTIRQGVQLRHSLFKIAAVFEGVAVTGVN